MVSERAVVSYMGNEHRPDTEGLARRALDDDPHAFTELVRRLHGRLELWISIRMGPLLRSRLTEDDVLQETLLQAHRSLGSFRDQGPDSFRRWMFSVAENRLRDLHKYHSAQKRDPGRMVDIRPRDASERDLLQRISAGDRSPSSAAHGGELIARLRQHIDALDEELREVLVMRAIEECTFPEIAERTGRALTTAKGLYARALTRLAEEVRG